MDVYKLKQVANQLSKVDSMGNRGQMGNVFAMVFGGVILFVMSIILIYNVALPQLNTAITSTSANLSGYAGAQSIASSTYIIAILSSLAAAAGLVFLFIRGEF